MFRIVLSLIKTPYVLGTTLILSAVLATSILAKADFTTPAFATRIQDELSPKMHLEEGIKSLKAGDSQGALMHFNAAHQGLTGSSSLEREPASRRPDTGGGIVNK
jgi:hypothetical protein